MKKIKKSKRKINLKKLLILLFFMFVFIIGCNKVKLNDNNNNGVNNNEPKPEPKLQIINPDSKTRPISVMINNHNSARPYHTGLQDAHLVYEMIVEGGITRMLAVFKDKDVSQVGPVRSARHYYLDYALENDAIYTHFGWSPKAQTDISSLGVANVNGLYDSGFWREDLPVAYEHKAFTNTENILKVAKNRNYRSETNKDNLLDYSISEININENEGSLVANNVSIKYSDYMTIKYNYDTSMKVYKRITNGKEHVDYKTKKQYTTKNIIVINVKNYTLDSSGRQDLKNIGTGDGYYITNGYAVPIKWSKKSRSDQTVYTYLDGKEITVNDGNTYIQIQPIEQKAIISE